MKNAILPAFLRPRKSVSSRRFPLIAACCLLLGTPLTDLLGISCAPYAAAAESDSEIKGDLPIRDKWALVVGVGKFQDATIPSLKYAAKDARDFRNFLVSEAHFAPDHVRLLLDEQATQRRVLSELGNKFLARVAKPDDLVVIYFSTHGSPAQADIRGENFIVAHDSDPEDLFTTGIEMDKILESIDARVLSQRVLLVLDACHSGVVTKGAKGLARSGNFDADKLVQGSGQLVITSSSPEQISWESKRYQNGIFTRKLLEGLRMNGRRTTLGDAFPFVEKSVSAEVQEDYATRQNPVLKSKWNGNALVVAAMPAAPQELPLAVRKILEPDSTVPRKVAVIPAPGSGAGVRNSVNVLVTASPQSTPARAAGNEYEKGVALFKKGDYASSITALKAAIKAGSGNAADANFSIANAYVKMNRIPEALVHFRESFRLNSNGKKADYCLQMISYYSKGASGNIARSSGTAPAGGSSSLSSVSASGQRSLTSFPESSSSAGANSSSASATVNSAELARIKSSLPRIKTCRSATPLLSEILNWSLQERANYLGEASSRVDEAQHNYKDGEDLLKKAKSMGYSLIPNNRTYGETEEAFRARKQANEAAYQELIVPYQKELEQRNRLLGEETAVLQACQSAQRELTPTGVYSGKTNATTAGTTCK